MVRSHLGMMLMLLVAPVFAQEPLVVKAEDCTTLWGLRTNVRGGRVLWWARRRPQGVPGVLCGAFFSFEGRCASRGECRG